MQNEITVRNAVIGDIPQIIEVEKDAWGEDGAASLDVFQSRMDVFPEGVFVAQDNNKLIGVGVLEIVDFDFDKDSFDWYRITDNGYLKKSHKNNGKYLYGVDLSVRPDYRRLGVGINLIENGLKVALTRGLEKFFLGSRIPDFHKYRDKMTAEDYVFAKDQSGRDIILDPELKFYIRSYYGSATRIKKIIPNYFNDPASLNYGVLIEWNNPFFAKDYMPDAKKHKG
jgi:predicted N-acetyltransferase YhbS